MFKIWCPEPSAQSLAKFWFDFHRDSDITSEAKAFSSRAEKIEVVRCTFSKPGKFRVTTSLTKFRTKTREISNLRLQQSLPIHSACKKVETNKLIDTLCLQKGWEQTKKPSHSACRIFWIPLIDQGTSCNQSSPYTLSAWIQTAHMPWISHILAITIQMPTVTMLRHMHSFIFAAKTVIFWLVSLNWHLVCNW